MPTQTIPPLATTDQYLRIVGESIDQLALDAASSAVRSYCGWDITKSDLPLTLDAQGQERLDMPALRISDVAAVRVNGDPITDYEWSAIGYLYRRHGWPNKYRSVQVDCTAGYDEVPPVLIAIVCSIASRVVMPYGVTQRLENAGGVSTNTSFAGSRAGVELSPEESAALDAFRIGSRA